MIVTITRPTVRREYEIRMEHLIAAAREHVMTPEERETQIRSFAYGNVALHNPSITRADIDQAAEETWGHGGITR